MRKPREPKDQKAARTERLENAKSKKRGLPLELMRPLTASSPADLGLANLDSPVGINELRAMRVGDVLDSLGARELYYVIATHAEGIRDVKNVRDVMAEKNIVGTVVPVRIYPTVARVAQVVHVFVTPKNSPTVSEVH